MVILKDKSINNHAIESSGQDLFIDGVVQKFIFKKNLITLLSRFTFIPKTGVRLPKTEIIFHCDAFKNFKKICFFFLQFFQSLLLV